MRLSMDISCALCRLKKFLIYWANKKEKLILAEGVVAVLYYFVLFCTILFM